MLAADHYPYHDVALPNDELIEIHRSKISLHHAKTDYSYPTIRLPHTFSALTGLSTQIFQTVHKGALAFLVVVSPAVTATKRSAEQLENVKLNVKSLRLDMAEVAGSNPAEPIVLLGCFDEIAGSGELLAVN
jgi:hypothetical protein